MTLIGWTLVLSLSGGAIIAIAVGFWTMYVYPLKCRWTGRDPFQRDDPVQVLAWRKKQNRVLLCVGAAYLSCVLLSGLVAYLFGID